MSRSLGWEDMEKEPETSGSIHTQLSRAEQDRMCVGWHLGLVSHRYTYMDPIEFKAELKLRVS